MDNLYSSFDCNQFKVGAHHNRKGMVIVLCCVCHAALASYSCLSIFPSSSTGDLEANLTTLLSEKSLCTNTFPERVVVYITVVGPS